MQPLRQLKTTLMGSGACLLGFAIHFGGLGERGIEAVPTAPNGGGRADLGEVPSILNQRELAGGLRFTPRTRQIGTRGRHSMSRPYATRRLGGTAPFRRWSSSSVWARAIVMPVSGLTFPGFRITLT